MRIFFAAGGTAGHIYPAIALAEYIQKKVPDAEFLFAASPMGMENTLVPQAGFKTVPIPIRGFRRSLSLSNLPALRDAILSVSRGRKILKDFAPDAVFATGGHVSYPFLRAASSLGIPSFLHESNAIPGFTAKFLSSSVTEVFLGMTSASKYFPKNVKTTHTGTPLRQNFSVASRSRARRELGIGDGEGFVVSFGGSLGADTMNGLCLSLMQDKDLPRGIRFLHATGKRNYQGTLSAVRESSISLHPHAQIVPYIENMPQVMAAADVVISRAGASTVAELTGLGKASILIPYPQATGDHQALNAQALASAGGCYCLSENNATAEGLKEMVMKLLSEPNTRLRMEGCAKRFSPQNACDRIFEAIRSHFIDKCPKINPVSKEFR